MDKFISWIALLNVIKGGSHMKRISILSIVIIFSSLCSLATSLELKASTNGASTDVVFGAGVNDFAKEKIKLSETDVANTYYGSGSLPYSSITKTAKYGGATATAYRSITGISGVTTFNYDWKTWAPSTTSAGVSLNFNVANAQYFTGGSYGSNPEGDYASTVSTGSSPTGVGKSSVSNLYTETTAYTDHVFSKLSANYGTGANYIWFDASSRNKEGESTYHWTDAYGTTSNPARIYYPYVESYGSKTYAGVYGSATEAYGTSALFRTHVENKAKMYGHTGTYYSGKGDFGFKTTNYAKLSGSVLGRVYTSSLSLTPSTNVASYRTALLLDPFRYEYVTKSGYTDWGNNAFNSLINKGQAVTYYSDSAVTHSRVGTMDDYYISAIKGHMNGNAIEITNAAESDRIVTGSELASMFTKNPQGLAIFAGCNSFDPKATSPIANAVKNKEWLSGGYTYSVDSAGNSQFMSKFFGYLSNGNTAKMASQLATQDVLYNYNNVLVVPIWTPASHDFKLL
jgi:hypothetical protein